MCIPKKPIIGKKICQPFSALLRPALRRLRQFSPSMFYCQATDFLGLKHSPASVASYTSVLAAWRHFAKAYLVPSSLLAALRFSLIILLQVPLKNSPNFQYKIGNFGPKQAFLGGIYGLFGSIIRLVQCSWSWYRLVRFVYRLLLVAVWCQHQVVVWCQQQVRVLQANWHGAYQFRQQYNASNRVGLESYTLSSRVPREQGSTQSCSGYRLIGTTGYQGCFIGVLARVLLVRRRISTETCQIHTAVTGPGQQDSSTMPALGFRFGSLCSRMRAI